MNTFMDEQKALLKRIVSKIKGLKERYEEQKEALRSSEEENIRLKARIRQLENKLITKNRYTSICNETPGSDKNLSSQKREDIKKLVREIDHCLILLEAKHYNKE